MDLNYLAFFMDKIRIPRDAQNEFLYLIRMINDNCELKQLLSSYKNELMNNNKSLKVLLAKVSDLSKKVNTSEYTLHFVFLISCTDLLIERYKAAGIKEEIFWDSMADFKWKLLECREVKGVWGNFVGDWYDLFLEMKRFALGRFQYEEAKFEKDLYEKNGIVINKEDKVYNFHIPSSNIPIDKETRYSSYKKAYEFFGCRDKKENLILVCNSWLLYEKMKNFLPKHSNILDFINDFDIISQYESDTFNDAWRVFGRHAELPNEELPRDTSLRRVIAEHLTSGGKMGSGYGVIVFDGEKIIN